MRSLPLETQTLYAELLEQLMVMASEPALGRLGGSLTRKRIRGESYLYWQVSQPGGRLKQFYLGRETNALVEAVERVEQRRQAARPSFARVERLAAQLRAAAFQSKARKDVVQAAHIFEALVELRPGDISLAWEALKGRGRRWEAALRRGLQALKKHDAPLHASVMKIVQSIA